MSWQVYSWQVYKRKGVMTARPYISGEDLTHISVSDSDTPSIGGMIARNPNNHENQWYIAEAYFAKNYEELG